MPVIQNLPLQHLIDDRDIQITHEYKIFESTLGDGYKQLAANGINNETRTVSIKYKNLRPNDYNTVLNFIRALKGVQPVFFTVPGETLSLWTVDPAFQSVSTITASYDPSLIIRSITLTLRTHYAF